MTKDILKKMAESGSVFQWYGSADPDQNVKYPEKENCRKLTKTVLNCFYNNVGTTESNMNVTKIHLSEVRNILRIP